MSEYEHCIAITVEPIPHLDCFRVGVSHRFEPSERND